MALTGDQARNLDKELREAKTFAEVIQTAAKYYDFEKTPLGMMSQPIVISGFRQLIVLLNPPTK